MAWQCGGEWGDFLLSEQRWICSWDCALARSSVLAPLAFACAVYLAQAYLLQYSIPLNRLAIVLRTIIEINGERREATALCGATCKCSMDGLMRRRGAGDTGLVLILLAQDVSGRRNHPT